MVALDSLGKFLEETEPVVEHLSYDDHNMSSFMKLMKVFTKVCIHLREDILLLEDWVTRDFFGTKIQMLSISQLQVPSAHLMRRSFL